MSTLAINMIRDTLITKAMPPISEDCLEDSQCKSYVLPGGLQTVTPYAFETQRGSNVLMFVTRNTPLYQVDFWDAGAAVNWTSQSCHTYGTSNVNTTAIQLCMKQPSRGKILTGMS